MDIPKYIGDVHPREYIKEMRVYCHFKQITNDDEILKFSKLMIDSTIDISSEKLEKIRSCEDLIEVLREHITFAIFKNSTIRKLHLLKYQLERDGGDTPKFIAKFRSLCRDAEIDEIDRRKHHLYYTLPNDFFRNEFIKHYDDINSMNDLVICFENTLNEYSRFILNGSVVALKHVATGKYLCSNNTHYATGSKNQVVFCGKYLRDSNSEWTIKCLQSPEFLPYDSIIYLQHNNTNNFLEICTDRHNLSPVSKSTEVSCGSNNNYSDYTWILDRSKSGSQHAYLKTQDIIVLRNKYPDYLTNRQNDEVLGSKETVFTVGDDKNEYQEVYAHPKESVSEFDEWCIELIE
ncbi:hypothetical protein RclHR1_07420012 [Rhizophagus clarus]|uniref:MIR domain-containing protein n=1 Tax=Rhizophagus clarus TaxID=94130 RepID=A0A2Z6RWC5_9GLOM|nr:hypothetical protein RclHR1_07420012 [Rhizophagus clarus]GES94920.1 hypothetical protein GLOIN_2v1494830 [Rhizophagus clarus]